MQNNWQAILTQNHFEDLKKLKRFSLSSKEKNLILNLSNYRYLLLVCNTLKSGTVVWVPNFRHGSLLDFFVGVDISDFLPDWAWTFSSKLTWIDFSNNEIRGTFPQSPDDDSNILKKSSLNGSSLIY